MSLKLENENKPSMNKLHKTSKYRYACNSNKLSDNYHKKKVNRDINNDYISFSYNDRQIKFHTQLNNLKGHFIEEQEIGSSIDEYCDFSISNISYLKNNNYLEENRDNSNIINYSINENQDKSLFENRFFSKYDSGSIIIKSLKVDEDIEYNNKLHNQPNNKHSNKSDYDDYISQNEQFILQENRDTLITNLRKSTNSNNKNTTYLSTNINSNKFLSSIKNNNISPSDNPKNNINTFNKDIVNSNNYNDNKQIIVGNRNIIYNNSNDNSNNNDNISIKTIQIKPRSNTSCACIIY